QPIRKARGAEVAKLVGGDWDQEAEQLGCQLSGNYVNFDGTVDYDAEGYHRYVVEYFEPMGRAIIDAWRAERAGAPATDFDAVVRGVLAG
ncbi:MAG: hypothetical protein ACYC62_06980, partial [Coriobacteriia bacterium]